MTDHAARLLLFTKDFTGQGADCFYWFTNDQQLVETDARAVVDFPGTVVCHDFWLIRDAVFDLTGTLPNTIIDLDEFRIAISGAPQDRLARERYDIATMLEEHGAEKETCVTYRRMFNKAAAFNPDAAAKAAVALVRMFGSLMKQAQDLGEAERFHSVEVPVYRLLQHAMAAGIAIDNRKLSDMRAEAEHEYFMRLKEYSEKHDMPLETPNRSSLEEKLLSQGFEMDDVSIEYLLEYLPHEKDFGSDTVGLQEADAVRRVLGSLTLSTVRTRPVVDIFGSRTSRIYLRSPSLQNIPKKYRGIIKASEGAKLSYVDYDQYEVGIMAALSGDTELKKLYAAGDMYDLFATTHLGLTGYRKAAKQLFLSYAYGMSRKALIDAAVSLGVDRLRSKAAFKLFEQYEDWKKSIWADFRSNGSVASLSGNHYRRDGNGQLTGKEQRSAVSQVVQGTASLIFKRALIDVAKLDDVKIVLPMHDALLFEHRCPDTPNRVVAAFENAMTASLDGRVNGKASIGEFARS